MAAQLPSLSPTPSALAPLCAPCGPLLVPAPFGALCWPVSASAPRLARADRAPSHFLASRAWLALSRWQWHWRRRAGCVSLASPLFRSAGGSVGGPSGARKPGIRGPGQHLSHSAVLHPEACSSSTRSLAAPTRQFWISVPLTGREQSSGSRGAIPSTVPGRLAPGLPLSTLASSSEPPTCHRPDLCPCPPQRRAFVTAGLFSATAPLNS